MKQESMKIDAGGEAIDLEVIRAKYAEERDKRLRRDGINQYIEISGDFSEFGKDPYVAEDLKRDPVVETVEILILGGGFSGIIGAKKLIEAGFEDIRIIENGGNFGGTWYWNRYPGAQCDVESYMYLPFLEETGYMPKEKYSGADEIREYQYHLGKTFGLYDKALFQTHVSELTWDEARTRWIVRTDRDDEIQARFVIMACGNLHRPKLPGIPGIMEFQGKMFHTSRWDHSYTGDDLSKLADKKVALVGTGATGVQCVPFIAEKAQQLNVFQRTPSVVAARNNQKTDPDWFKDLQAGWQRERRENFYSLVSGVPQEVDLVQDGWTEIMRILGSVLYKADDAEGAAKRSKQDIDLAMEYADAERMMQVRNRIEEIVQSHEVAENLKPWFRFFCKRPTFNDGYLQAFNRPNVTLVDTKGLGVERITPTGVVSGGVEYPTDLIVFATGFEVGTDYSRQLGLTITGTDGLTLSDHWDEDYQTLHGISINRFPNLMVIGQVQSVGGANIVLASETQADYIVELMKETRRKRAKRFEPTDEAVSAWVEHFHEKGLKNEEFLRNCTPGYYNNEGQPGERKGFISARYGAGLFAFNELVEQWRKDGFEGMTFQLEQD
ncbi:flavin-containing monooxygenase [Celeribacter indicus]|nr:NAD(P)/FAD-dependent oxidoreductase [Celeribacter indicus]SDW25041.1 cyclohexanone monooxygenase [Celeribacter indicus]